MMKKILMLFAVTATLFSACKEDEIGIAGIPQSPSILKIYPVLGLENSTVELIGKRFSSNANENIVKFAGIKAEVISASDTLLKVIAPAGGSTGAITISVNNRLVTGPTFAYAVPTSGGGGNEPVDEYDFTTSLYAGVPNTASAVNFILPNGVAIDPTTGDLIVSDRTDQTIKRVTTAGVITRIAGTSGTGSAGAAQKYTLEEAITSTIFNNPYQIAVDKIGNIYVTNNSTHKIKKIDVVAKKVYTIAGGGTDGRTSGYLDGRGTQALFNGPSSIAVDDNFNVYVGDAANHVIRKITTDGRVTTIAGTGTAGIADGFWPNTTLNRPQGICMGTDGFLYAADRYGQRIRKINLKTGEVITIAGSGGSSSSSGSYLDGAALSASFNNIWGITQDNEGTIYVSELGATGNTSHRIRMIRKGMVSTVGGDVAIGYANGNANESRFNNPSHLTTDADGNIYVADQSNNVIRKIVKVKK